MEKRLDRALKFLKDSGVLVGVLVTDQIDKWLTESHKDVKHFDVWHVAKGEFHHHKNISHDVFIILRCIIRTTQKNWQKLKIAISLESGVVNHLYWASHLPLMTMAR